MPGTRQTFALVVPTLNESGNIRSLLERATAALADVPVAWKILVVDDDSTDATGDIVHKYAESESRVRLLVRRGQRGLAGAIQYGWTQSSADLLGVIDADLQHPPELLPILITKVCNGSDLAIASRYARPHDMDEWNAARRLLSRLGVMVSLAVQRKQIRVKDPLSGFFVLRRECIDGLSFQPTGFKLLLEILTRGRINSVVEVPFKFGVRRQGSSKADAMTAIHYVSLLYRLFSIKSDAGHRPSCS